MLLIYQELIDALELNLLTDQYTVNDAVELNAKIQEAIKNQQNKIRVRYMKGSYTSNRYPDSYKRNFKYNILFLF